MPYDPDDPGGFSLRSRNPETKTLQLEYWNRRSRGYNLTTLIELHDTSVCTQLISGLLPKGRRSKVCDMGTACGYAAITAAKMGHEVTAVDYSESMINHAKYTARQERLDIKFIVADAEELSFPEESFDLIIAKSIIWCLEQPVRAIANWMRFLKPGGHILIIDGNYSRTIEMRLKYCDTAFLLDYPLEVCLEGAKSRIGKQREDLPWLEEELDEDFRQWIIDFPKTKLPEIYRMLEEHGTGKEIHVFHSREEADQFLESYRKKSDDDE